MPDEETKPNESQKEGPTAPTRGVVYTDVMGNPLEDEQLALAKKNSSVGRPVSRGEQPRNSNIPE